MALLSDENLAQLSRLQLNARQIVEGFLIGLHKSPYHGFSVEFADHRQYNPGESLKNVDWKIVARTGRYYVKRYEEETNLRCYILLDHSKSMFYSSGDITKIDYAKRLAASLSWLMIAQKDAAGLYTFNNKITSNLSPKAFRSYTAQIFSRLVQLEPEESTDILSPLHQIAESIKKRSLIVLISDLMEDEEKIIQAFKHFRNHRHELIVFHIYDPKEQSLEFKRETQFIDSESGEKITVNPWQIRKDYRERYDNFYKALKESCHQLQVEYNPVPINQDINELLLKYLIKRKKGL
ncbi:MAG: DUF58 domain-containing protein [Candidatus Cloacimonadaceae bacterium]|jgi:uncharacterized protein (DUF58 family)|nr:DUF58 domain-containing protein [Candidatus Cloacimonadota bacterium]MDY0128519.1 DUF58 domain-containing protein [Candidatus Cloacimonadaceae bacterium]MCB5255272.1 DUF58 domain-containing protein [Candidatus Cloacimonadota bacterium]MCK9177980.1 DUF58 domain-containing protein [Candidatus Cloacimonadota bacterium]MCK9243126.1 DUF58 domain-containing protein [Candidatus Cloacimonadota bacterium]